MVAASGLIQAAISRFTGNDPERYSDSDSSSSSSNQTIIYGIINLIIFMGALFLAFKCKKEKFLQIVLACCCSPCYLVYRLAVPCK